ncbi:MAG: hypothetical protein F2842_03970 [Actinobacteria bacterium]|uniref:Unannotated protein n=1 Tax=freshwater metagenome TaxID=449393 RepID=A0A6J7JAM2_9ZZZZ|nr:hypothetical protein [Actinomycetota bacterium]
MAPQPIVIVGAGGMGREVLQLVRDIENHSAGSWEFAGFLDEVIPAPNLMASVNAHYVGRPSDTTCLNDLPSNCAFAVAVGSGIDRSVNFDLLGSAGLEPATLIHPTAVVGSVVTMEPGQTVCAGTVITTNVRLGVGTQINMLCTVAHDVVVGSFVTLSPGAIISGSVTIGSFATIGSNASVIPGVTLGEGCTVGAGAAVIRDVEPGTTVVGVPAHPISGR